MGSPADFLGELFLVPDWTDAALVSQTRWLRGLQKQLRWTCPSWNFHRRRWRWSTGWRQPGRLTVQVPARTLYAGSWKQIHKIKWFWHFVWPTREKMAKMRLTHWFKKITNNHCCFWVHIKALSLLFEMRYGSPVCYEYWLCDSPKYKAHLHEVSTSHTYAWK